LKPFFFGDSARPLLGRHHPPPGAPARRWSVVLCNPFGQEYLRAHRSLRELAHRLAQAGFHVLRFDYYGCGDSAGESDEGSLAQWQADIEAAVDEVREAAGTPRVALVGLRLGATLAALVAERRADLDHLVLLDPIVDGAAYLRELKAADESWLREHAHREVARGEGPPAEALGFPVAAPLAESLGGVRLDPGRWPAAHVLVVDHRAYAGAPVWVHDDGFERALVPHAALEAITSWLGTACA
jgi:pimeloyl-ACP methyl ester carboxylesterase